MSTICAASVPDGALDIIGDQVKRLAAKGNGTLGLTLAASLLLSLWSANGGVKSVFDALNIAYQEPEKRGFFRLDLQSLVLTGGALLFVILALTAIVVVPVALQFRRRGREGLVCRPSALAGAVAGGVFGLAVLYRFGPSRNKAKWRWVSPGSALAAVLWLAGRACSPGTSPISAVTTDLWLARRGDRLHDLDLDLDHRCAAWRGTQCRNGAPDGKGHHKRGAKTPRARRAHAVDTVAR